MQPKALITIPVRNIEDRDKIRRYNRKYRSANKDKIRQQCKEYRLRNRDKILQRYKKYHWANRDRILEKYRQLRLAALIKYGGNPPRCDCCGEAMIQFLSIDHINGNGGKHRKEIGQLNIYRWLKKMNYPKGLRVLCYNCNFSIGHYGFCPHQRKQIIKIEEKSH